jgi:hypothetical protein
MSCQYDVLSFCRSKLGRLTSACVCLCVCVFVRLLSLSFAQFHYRLRMLLFQPLHSVFPEFPECSLDALNAL